MFDIKPAKIDDEFLNMHYGKLEIIHNKNELVNCFDGDNNDATCVKNILNKIGFAELKGTVKKDVFDANINGVLEMFTDEYMKMFSIRKSMMDKLNAQYGVRMDGCNNKAFLGFINRITERYGYGLKTICKVKYNKISKKKTQCVEKYKIQTLPSIC